MVCRWPQSEEDDWARPHLCKLARHGPWPVRKRFIRDHVWRGRSKPGCRIVRSVTTVWMSTEADDQSSLHCVTVSTDVMSYHIGRRDASRGGGCICWQLWSGHTHTRLTALCPGLPKWAGTLACAETVHQRPWQAVQRRDSRCCGLVDEVTAVGGTGTRNTPAHTHTHVRRINCTNSTNRYKPQTSKFHAHMCTTPTYYYY